MIIYRITHTKRKMFGMSYFCVGKAGFFIYKRKEIKMQRYKKFLKYILAVNIMFVLVVAGLGYENESKKKEIAEVSRQL